MAPEQSRGEALDARADVFAAGVVLAEMVAPGGDAGPAAGRVLWDGVRQEPPQLPDTPVARRSCSGRWRSEREARYGLGARADPGAGGGRRCGWRARRTLQPYPGLASFTEADAEYFFGREAEVEALWQQAASGRTCWRSIGPSGAGKSSFLRAGCCRRGRRAGGAVRLHAGRRARSLALARALAPGAAPATPEAIDAAAALRGPGGRAGARAALARAARRRRCWSSTSSRSCSRSTARGAGALRGAARPAWPSRPTSTCCSRMRDDFLLRCHEHAALAPALRGPHAARAPRPAPRCAGRSSSRRCSAATASRTRRWPDEMLDAVEGERGALPLLAFAAARLWERARPGAGPAHPRGLRADRRGRRRAGAARRGDARADRHRAPADRARALPQPRHRAGHPRRARRATSCCRSSATGREPRRRRSCAAWSTRGC